MIKYDLKIKKSRASWNIHEQFEKLDFEKNGRFRLKNEKSKNELEI